MRKESFKKNYKIESKNVNVKVLKKMIVGDCEVELIQNYEIFKTNGKKLKDIKFYKIIEFYNIKQLKRKFFADALPYQDPEILAKLLLKICRS